ncbi:hypothetical protein SCY21_22630, partial [Xanthomonas euvesicatoria]|uniref:hypothetical protein n=1 Tax=Xanthomonas euvesicatoria TaxID=456327 RepID=UPI00298DB168
ARVGLFDKPDDLLGAESALLHVRPLGFTDFIASAGTAQWGQVTRTQMMYQTLMYSTVLMRNSLEDQFHLAWAIRCIKKYRLAEPGGTSALELRA